MNKFFNNIGYKNKVLYFSSLLLTTSIVCPLTSCGSDNTSNDIGGFDKEFGFDAQTYNNLEKQFTSKYGAYLWNITKDKDEYINKFDNFLQNDLTILRNKLFDPTQNYSFTVRTNTLIDYASKNFNINLNRNTNVSDIDFDNLRQSSLENFVICMENMGFSNAEIDEEKAKFNKEFDDILKDCKSKTDDNAKILMQLRADVINCWQNLDDEFAHLSAYNHLKKFFDEYEFVVKDQSENLKNSNVLLWDNLLNDSKFMGENNAGKIDQDINHIIDEEQINDLFTISKKSEESEKKEDDKDTPANNTSLTETNSYNKEIIPGYILTPVLKTMSQNIYSNEYYMNIDWQLMYAKYQDKDQETKNKVTAHLAYNKNEQMANDDNYSYDLNNNNFSSNDYQFTRYSLKATPDYQIKKMTEAYFDQTKESDQKITFSWDSNKIGIEYFLPSNIFGGENGKYNLPQDDKYKVSMTQDNLSLIGLKLNNINLSDLLNKQKNLQDNQSTNDDNLTIEEKFVKYCDINANAIVEFNDTTDISKNNITNKFINVYKNTNLPNEVKIEQDLQSSNITKSKNFTNNAVLFFNNIVNFIDTNKITTEVDSSAKLTTTVNVEIWIVLAITILIFIELIRERKFGFKYIHPVRGEVRGLNRLWKDVIKIIILITILAVGLILTWYFFIYKPINDQNQNIKNWNDAITNKSTSTDQIKIINNVSRDGNNFKSNENFDKYFKNNQFDAFRSYFYYFHFNHLISKNNEESSKDDDMRKEIDNDYKQFNDTKKQYNVTINEDKWKYCFIIIASIIVLFLIIFLINLLVNYFKFKKNTLAHAAALAAAHGAHGVHHGLQH